MKALTVCVAILILVIAACDNGSSSPAGKAVARQPAVAQQAAAADVAAAAAERQRKLIRTADVGLLVDDAAAASARITELARSFGGFVAESTLEKRPRRAGARLVLRIPVTRFDEALTALKSLAKDVARITVSAEDVTDRYVDLEARRRSLALAESELEKLLSESRAQNRNAAEIMAIYKELTEIRTQREQEQGLKQSLDNRIALSTIRVALYLDKEALAAATPAWKPLDAVDSSFASLIHVLKALVDAVIFFAIVLLPVLILIGIPVWLLVKWQGRRRKEGTKRSEK